MNEQIQAVLQQRITKTAKMEALLLMGLTRRQVADLVTNGNYGFVQNVYKRMLESGRLPGTTATAALQNTPELDYAFTRRFGIEIEAYNCEKSVLARALREEGINVQVESYNHNTSNGWKIVSDSSLNGNNTFELVSPILEGEAGLAELKIVTWVLDLCNVKVNGSCGLHIHFDASGFNMDTWKNILKTYKNIEPIIDNFMPASRRDNNYCRKLTGISTEKINAAQTVQDLQDAFYNNRYYKVNVQSYSRHRTLEFRQHGGTTDFDKMENWVRFLNGLLTFATVGEIHAGTTLAELPFLTNLQKSFLKIRTKKLNRR